MSQASKITELHLHMKHVINDLAALKIFCSITEKGFYIEHLLNMKDIRSRTDPPCSNKIDLLIHTFLIAFYYILLCGSFWNVLQSLLLVWMGINKLKYVEQIKHEITKVKLH